jgi:hypothetical protein
VRSATGTADVSAGLEPLQGGVNFANNVVFSGYSTSGGFYPGEYLGVWLGWWLHGPPQEDVDYHFSVQILQHIDQDTRLISQDDHVAFPANYWQGGDMVLSYFLLPLPLHLPSGNYSLQAGMYSYPDIVSVPVIDSSGQSVDTSAKLTRLEYTE